MSPRTVRVAGATGKGYKRDVLDRIVARYLPQTSVTPSQLSNDTGFQQNRPVTQENNVTDKNRRKASNEAVCDVVTDRKDGCSDTLNISDTYAGIF